MAALTQNLSPAHKKNEIAVYGYVRENFDDNCWVNEVIQIIIQFYISKGGSLYMRGSDNCGQLGIKEWKDRNNGKFTPPFTQQNALDVSVGYEHTLIVDIDGNVWGCGNASNGRLGIDFKKDTFVFTPQKLNLAYSVVSVAAGYCASLLLFSNGYVAQIHGEWEYENNVPIVIESLKSYKIIQIAAGQNHFACLTDDGVLFCFGDAEKGQCGIGEQGDDDNEKEGDANENVNKHESDSDDSDSSSTSSSSYEGYWVDTPTKVKLQEKIVFVGCGMDHTLLITSDGLTYSFGSGKDGKLGHGSSDNYFVPTLIDGLKEKNIIKCAGGVSHSICVNSEGIVWCFGDNRAGECGLGKDIARQSTPAVVEYFVFNNIKAIDCAAGLGHSGIIASDGSLYVFGTNHHRELVMRRNHKKDYTPFKFSTPQNKDVKHVSMQWTHTAIITKE